MLFRSDLYKEYPVWEAVLASVVSFLPNPMKAQKYRMKAIWSGDIASESGQAMINLDSAGPTIVCICKVENVKGRLIATGRVFSGSLKKGMQMWLVGQKQKAPLNQLSIFMGSRMESVVEIPAGNIAAIGGFQYIRSGETLFDAAHVQDSKPFEEVKYMSEPVVTVAVEPDMLKNLNRLQEILEEIKIEDPNINFEISNESGECLLSGVGPLHLETIASSIKERGVDVSVSKPSSVFRESVANASKICSATSPNGLNQVEIIVKRNSDKTVAYLRTAKSQVLENEGIRAKELPLHTDLSPDDIKTISHIDKFQNTICLVKAEEETKSKDKMDLYRQIGEATQALIRKGILAQEPLSELLIIVKPLQLASNPDDANYFELSTMIQTAFMAAINDAVPILLEPIFTLMITTPEDLIGTVTSLVTQHLGKITEISQDPYRTFVHAKMSVRKSIEFSAEIRSETSGRVFWQTLFDSFQPVPDTQKDQIIQDIKFRKGLAFR